MNIHVQFGFWMVLYKLCVFCFDMKFKMAATVGLSLTLDGKTVLVVSEKKHFETFSP
jgi:predicted adenine nucleotide alpha hydrolase (AANH) superfamily ATPase